MFDNIHLYPVSRQVAEFAFNTRLHHPDTACVKQTKLSRGIHLLSLIETSAVLVSINEIILLTVYDNLITSW